MNDFYVYICFRPTGVPFYVGKGRGARYRRPHGVHYDRIVDNAGGEVPVVKIEHLTEPAAYVLEEQFIRAIGIERDGGPLINLGYGGKGGPTEAAHWKDPVWRANEMARRRATGMYSSDRMRANRYGGNAE